MKLNFKALVASLVVCSTQFSTLPAYNTSVSAMNTVGTPVPANSANSGVRTLDNGSITYSISPKGGMVLISKCPNGNLTREVLRCVLQDVRGNGYTPHTLHLGSKMKSMDPRAFNDIYMGRIKIVAICDESPLHKGIESHGHYCWSLKNIEEDKGLKFGHYDRKNMSRVTHYYYDWYIVMDYGGRTTRTTSMNRRTYNHWSNEEESRLARAMHTSNHVNQLTASARREGIERRRRTDNSIRAKAYRNRWRAKK